jgi:hypothetical protein
LHAEVADPPGRLEPLLARLDRPPGIARALKDPEVRVAATGGLQEPMGLRHAGPTSASSARPARSCSSARRSHEGVLIDRLLHERVREPVPPVAGGRLPRIRP